LTIIRVILLLVPCLATTAVAQNSYELPPNGGAVIIPSDPIWLTGIQDSDSVLSDISGSFPERQEPEYFDVVNAGFYLAMRNGELHAIYFFQLNVKEPFKRKVYTRTILENPENSDDPISYEHYLAPGENSTRVTHSPVTNVKSNRIYNVTLEVYANRKRTKLIERITQPVQASFDNSSGCIKPSAEARSLLFVDVKIDEVEIPAEKQSWPCKN